jgi:beta-lactamase regulating signal transducer with metallopeptidase domain
MSLGTLVLIAAVKGSVLLAAAWLVVRAFPRLSAALRHLVWACALGGLVLMPFLVRVVPTLQSRFVPTIPVVTSIQTTDLIGAPIAMPAATPVATTSAAERASRRRAMSAPIESVRAQPRSINLEYWFPVAWAIVAVVLLMRVAIGRLRLALLARRASIVDDGDWLLLAQRLAYRLDISRPITLLRGDQACVPMTWGLVYPTVLLPADADDWTAERRTIVLLHELAHVNRLDAFTQLIAQIATAIFWFNPLAWLAARAMRVERELACDDCVLTSGARASDYAQDLLQIARTFSTRSDLAVAALAMARRGDLEERLLAILDPATDRRSVSRARLIGATLAILALSVPLAALSPAPVQAAERSFQTAAVSTTPVAQPRVARAVVQHELVTRMPRRSESVTRLLPAPIADVQRIPSASGNEALRIPAVRAPYLPHVAAATARAATPDRETLISVAQAAVKLTSGYDKAELLVPIAKYYLADDGLATAYITAAVSIANDDYNCSRAINALLEGNAPLSDKVVELAMNAVAKRFTADYQKRTVIEAMLGNQRVLGPESRRSVIAGIATISASYDRRAAISAFVARRQFNEQDAIGLINAATSISGSYDRAQALIDIATHHGLDDAGVRDAYVKAAETIQAGSDYRRAIEALLKRS